MPAFRHHGHTIAAIAMFCTFVIVSCGGSPPKPTVIINQTPPQPTASGGDYLLGLINAQRAKERLPELVMDHRLEKAALEHSTSMAQHQYVSHRGKDGKRFPQRMARYGYPHSHSAENLAMSPSADRVFMLWHQSKGHRVNMMKRKYLRAGIARVGNYWTAVFAAPDGT